MNAKSQTAGRQAMIGVDDARRRILEGIRPVEQVESVKLDRALRRVLAEPTVAACNVPPFDNSAMDGYAFRLDDLEQAGGSLPLSARVPAGVQPAPLAEGSAVRIFTGAVIPEGADTVAMQEVCEADNGKVHIQRSFRRGANIRRSGEDIAAGQTVVAAGRRLLPQDLGLLASTGIDRVNVRRRVKVAVLATGDELVEPGRPLLPGRIYNSNTSTLIGLLGELGCELEYCRPVADTPEATTDAMRAAVEGSDLVITSGGVSVGEADHVRDVIEALGRLELWKIAVKPGKPLAFGRIGDVPILGLPGNPVAVFVGFCLFAAPLIRKLQGRADLMPAPVPVVAGFAAEPGTREDYQRVRLVDGQLQPYPHQGSGVLSSVAWADGLARLPIDRAVEPGQGLDYFPFSALLD